jgi:hypothetical protein
MQKVTGKQPLIWIFVLSSGLLLLARQTSPIPVLLNGIHAHDR